MPVRLLNDHQIHDLLALLRREHAAATTALSHTSPFELLAATILSAQCTDLRVNKVTPVLFAAYKDPAALASANLTDVESIIHSTGFYRNKAKNLVGMATGLVTRFGGEVPRTMDELLTLPGVARKTANVVLGSAFGIAAGVVVDTHVIRLSRLLGLSRHDEPEKIERDLMAKIPRSAWIFFSHALILHGRQTCIARRPRCERCVLSQLCPSAFRAFAPQSASKASPRARAAAAKRSPGRGGGQPSTSRSLRSKTTGQ
ncbi:MAG: endonuclease III [Deltaproteobacteria bacterium]|nr:endonuclease III [Deltaproteobacteria bacterium]